MGPAPSTHPAACLGTLPPRREASEGTVTAAETQDSKTSGRRSHVLVPPSDVGCVALGYLVPEWRESAPGVVFPVFPTPFTCAFKNPATAAEVDVEKRILQLQQ